MDRRNDGIRGPVVDELMKRVIVVIDECAPELIDMEEGLFLKFYRRLEREALEAVDSAMTQARATPAEKREQAVGEQLRRDRRQVEGRLRGSLDMTGLWSNQNFKL